MTNIRSLVDNIVASDNVTAQEKIADIMAEKLQTLLDLAKIEVANEMFNTCEDCNEPVLTQEQYDALSEDEKADYEEIDEALVGGQKKIDANKNGKLDAHDFKMLRAKKGMKEEVEDLDELSKQTLSAYIKKAGPQITGLRQKHGLTSKPAMKRSRGVTRASINYLKKDLADLRKEEVAQVDENTFEQGGKMKTDTKPRHVSPLLKNVKKRSYDEIRADALKNAGLTDVSKKSPAVKKEEVAHEAYSDPYAAKKSAEMKKAHAATMADAKKEYDAAKKSKFAKNFMKMKKEEVEQVDEVITKKTPTGEVVSDFVHSKNAKFKGKSKKERIRMALGAKYAMMKNEESELQELDKSTMISYLQKRHFQGKKTTPKQEKGRMNALSAIDTKNHGKKRSDKEKAASSMSGAQADYKKGTYSGD